MCFPRQPRPGQSVPTRPARPVSTNGPTLPGPARPTNPSGPALTNAILKASQDAENPDQRTTLRQIYNDESQLHRRLCIELANLQRDRPALPRPPNSPGSSPPRKLKQSPPSSPLRPLEQPLPPTPPKTPRTSPTPLPWKPTPADVSKFLWNIRYGQPLPPVLTPTASNAAVPPTPTPASSSQQDVLRPPSPRTWYVRKQTRNFESITTYKMTVRRAVRRATATSHLSV